MLFSALILGLISSLHCIGMCGPIAMMLPVSRSSETKKAAQLLLYHSGRLISYALLGLIFGFFGRGLYLAGIQQELSLISGMVIIAIVLLPEKKIGAYLFSKPVYKVVTGIKAGLGLKLTQKSSNAFFITGLLNGFLPCGMVYAALFGAIALQNPFYGAVYMALYGAGTIPLMSLVVYTAAVLKSPFRNRLNKIMPYAAVAVGILFIMRGMGLGILYISPGNINLFIQHIPQCK